MRSAALACLVLAASSIPLRAQVSSGTLVQEKLAFLRQAAAEANDDLRGESVAELEAFIEANAGAAAAGEAQVLLAEVLQKRGDHEEAAVAWLEHLYEHPGSLAAQRSYMDLVEKKLPRKLRPALGELVKVGEGLAVSERLGELWHRLATQAPEVFEKPLERGLRRFEARFPDYKQGDRLLWDLAEARAKNSRPAAALLAHKKLLALYPASAYRAQSQWAVGEGYEKIKEHDKAIDAYQELVERHPQTPQVLPAMEATARLLEEKKKQHALAVEAHEKIIKAFPKSPGALKAYKAKARLQRDKLDKPAEAVESYRRLAEAFGDQEGFSALTKAAQVARKDLKDYPLEIELRRKASSDFSTLKEAAEELFTAAEVYEDDLKDAGKAAEAYREVAAKFPSHKLAKKAQDRLAKLAKP